MISTIAYIVYDLMTETVKDYKIDLAASTTEVQVDATVAATPRKQMQESNVNLYRYGVFALLSLLKNNQASSHDQHFSDT